jgi:hypothetical protein
MLPIPSAWRSHGCPGLVTVRSLLRRDDRGVAGTILEHHALSDGVTACSRQNAINPPTSLRLHPSPTHAIALACPRHPPAISAMLR